MLSISFMVYPKQWGLDPMQNGRMRAGSSPAAEGQSNSTQTIAPARLCLKFVHVEFAEE